MKNKRIIAILLIAVLVLSGCNTPGTAPSSAVSSQEEAAESSAENSQEADESSAESQQESENESADETSPEKEEGSPAESDQEETSDSSAESESEEASEKEDPEAEEPQLYEFNPHLQSYLLAPEIPQDHWDALNNLNDALRVGADTFECANQESYDWVMDDVVQANLLPPAYLKIASESSDGTIPYENGVGRIYYKMPAEEYVTRQAEFEQMVVDVLNEWLEKDDDDYEKCLKLYDYMESNYTYNYDLDPDEEVTDGYVYYTFLNHTGQCIDLGGLYSYLLMQAGVEALSVGSYDGLDHDWTYAIVNGRGYHIDPTWALKAERYTDTLFLDYFMMSDEIREETGCTVSDLTVQLLPQFFLDRSSITLPATDESYYLGPDTAFRALDEENKILYYFDSDGVEQELNYR